jgi:thiamine biosynthesis protein ThiI
MNYDVILVRYGELSLKSAYVRHYFESTLIRNIKKALTKEALPHTITKDRGRIYLTTPEISRSLAVLPRIFGIVSFSPAVKTTSTLPEISALALKLSKNLLTKEKSFAIRTTRTGKHEFTSQEVAIHIGNDLVKSTSARVDLTYPDVELFIEIRDQHAYLFTEKCKGPGGLPLGTQGKIVALIDEPTSLLAAWYLMRRGCNIILVTSGKSNEETLRSFLHLWYTDPEIILLDFKGKNFFDQLNTIALQHNCDAVITGHTLEEPARTLEEITKLKQQIAIPVLTPLIAMTHKQIQHEYTTRGKPQ